jgi:hypothetical protein
MSLKLHFFAFPCGFFFFLHENMGAICDENGKRFHHIFPKLKWDIVENGVQIFWLTAA